MILAPIDISILLENGEISTSLADLGEATATDTVDATPTIQMMHLRVVPTRNHNCYLDCN